MFDSHSTAGHIDDDHGTKAILSRLCNPRRITGRALIMATRSTDPRVMTQVKLAALIKQGLGSNRDARYLPWIRVRRRLTSKVSNLFVIPSVLYERRGLHLLSGLEHRAALLAQWLGATELREQFPMWPDPHQHPLSGIDPERDKTLAQMPGLLEIARNAGIRHGVYPGTKIPFVATSDIVLRLGHPPNDRLVLWACKPLAVMLDAERQRTLERLELERLYAVAAGATSVVIDDSTFKKNELAKNLDWLTPLHSELLVFAGSTRLEDFSQSLDERLKTLPIRVASELAGRKVRADLQLSHQLFRLAVWSGLTDIDLSKPILMTRFAALGGRKLKRQIAQHLLGAEP